MLDSALEHYRRQQRITAAAVLAIRREKGGSLAVARVLAAFQLLAAQDAVASVPLMLEDQGIDAPLDGTVAVSAVAGTASDGRPLDTLVDYGMNTQSSGWLAFVAATQIQDAARTAAGVAIAARPGVGGWVRMMNPPSCSRCAVLAGRFYRWSDGFERHPMCDCRHLACSREAAAGLSDGPEAYFESLSEEQQNRLFGKANADAIRDGSDIGQVMNATTRPGAMFTADNGRRYTREGGTRRGLFGQSDVRQRKSRVLRPTPLQIYRDAGGDRAEAVRMLKQFRYLL